MSTRNKLPSKATALSFLEDMESFDISGDFDVTAREFAAAMQTAQAFGRLLLNRSTMETSELLAFTWTILSAHNARRPQAAIIDRDTAFASAMGAIHNLGLESEGDSKIITFSHGSDTCSNPQCPLRPMDSKEPSEEAMRSVCSHVVKMLGQIIPDHPHLRDTRKLLSARTTKFSRTDAGIRMSPMQEFN